MSTTVEYILDVKTGKATKALGDTAKKTDKVGKSLNDTKMSGLAAAGALGAAFTGIGAAAGIAANAVGALANTAIKAAQAMFELTTSVVDNINDLNDLSTVSGISAQNIEALRTAFVASGQSADSANTILKMFPRIMNQLSNETSDASKVFRGLGLSLRDAAGNAKSADQVFIEMIHAVQGIDDQTQKARTAMALFGRQASGVVQALGADKFEAFTDAVERYGTRAGPEASKSAAQFQKNLALLDLVTKRTKQSFVENTGVLRLFEVGLKNVVAAVTALNVFLQSGAEGLKQLGQAGLLLVNLVLRQLFEGFKKLVLQGMKPTFDLLNMLSEQVTGQSIFGNLAKTIGDLTINTFDLNDAVDDGIAAYRKELEILNENTSTKDGASKTAAQLARDYKLVEGVLGRLNKATKKDTKDTKDNTDAKKEQQRAEKARLARLKKQAQLLKILANENKKRLAAIKEVRDIIKDAGSDQITELEKINRLEQERLDKLILIGMQEGINTDAAKKAVQERAERERRALQQRQIAGQIGIAQTAIGAASDPTALIGAVAGAFGPIGSAIGGVVQALSDLGQKDPEQIKEEFRATFEGIAQGIKILVPLLIEALPPILFDAALVIVDAILRLPIQLLSVIGKGLVQAFKAIGGIFTDPLGFLGSIIDAIFDAIKRIFDFFTQPFQEGFGGSMMGGGRMLSGQGGLRFTGGDGLAMLHQGEMVVPRSGQISSSVARDAQAAMGGSGSVNIIINSIVTERSAIDELVEKIEERYGSFGQSTNPLFGGR
ncbi:MAG: phage tail tape measure protein [Pseudomonadota bacterium]|nr:phage tail tape measure protein [Pseudomonadota bacterium]